MRGIQIREGSGRYFVGFGLDGLAYGPDLKSQISP